MKSLLPLFIILFLFLTSIPMECYIKEDTNYESIKIFFEHSIRSLNFTAVIVPDSNPFFCLVGTSIACWYDKVKNTTGLLPLLVQHKNTLTDTQTRFLNTYITSTNQTLLTLGEHLKTTHSTKEILGSPPEVSLALATQMFTTSSAVLILPYKSVDAYQLSILATPLASYFNIPILIYDNNDAMIQTVCTQLQTKHIYLIGNIFINLTNVTLIHLPNEVAITQTILTVIKDQFGAINYLTMTNPSDVIPPTVIKEEKIKIHDHILNKKIIILNKDFDIIGEDTREYEIFIPEGINRVHIFGEILQNKTHILKEFSLIVPIIFMTLIDAKGQVIAYGNSMAYDFKNTYIETLACNASDTYTLQVKVFNGVRGGYFVQRGISWFDADINITTTITTLKDPHLPLIPNLSIIAPYLTAAHGGIIIANTTWELTDSFYGIAAKGSGTGPWYNKLLHPFTNAKVNTTVNQLKRTLDIIDNYELLTGYLNGPAWLAILADTNMIPMYYFNSSQTNIPDQGLPSDNPYSLNANLSVGRLINWNIQDVSSLIARTFFYEVLCGPPKNQNDWHSRFSFIFGEGFGETGGIFHQIPYAQEIKNYGFNPKIYGDLRNSRQIADFLNVYTGSNYIEYLGHGDWFWFPASLYGFDMYSKAVDVAHAKNWIYEKPSIFLSSACLMGRIDGLPSQMNIGLAMLHAGCNGFVGSTRETGQESGLTTLENHLIVDDFSLGEALRGEKRVDTELPTFYVRVFYGDPAFNPYEPQHGFSNQGRPIFI